MIDLLATIENMSSVAARAANTGLEDTAVAHSSQEQFSLTFGTGSGGVNAYYILPLNIAAGANLDVVLDAGLVNTLRETFGFAVVKYVKVILYTGGSIGITVGGHPTNAAKLYFEDVTDKHRVKPGGIYIGTDPAGVTVPASGTLRITNLDGVNAALGKLFLFGEKI